MFKININNRLNKVHLAGPRERVNRAGKSGENKRTFFLAIFEGPKPDFGL